MNLGTLVNMENIRILVRPVGRIYGLPGSDGFINYAKLFSKILLLPGYSVTLAKDTIKVDRITGVKGCAKTYTKNAVFELASKGVAVGSIYFLNYIF